MEEQLVQEHMELERVVAIRKEKDGKVGYLCKWRGLPYAEATWEPVEIIQVAKASDKVDAFQVSLPPLSLRDGVLLTEAACHIPFSRACAHKHNAHAGTAIPAL